MNIRASLPLLCSLLLMPLTLGGCAKISLDSLPGGKPAQTGAGNKSAASLLADANKEAGKGASSLEGYWTIAFQFNGKVGKASMQLHQEGNQLSGSGTDDESSRAFTVTGTVDGQNVHLVKKYEAPDSAHEVPPIEYTGQIQMVSEKDYQGPYMNGKYSTVVKGQQISDDWEAQISGQGTVGSGTQQAAATETTSAPAQAPPPDKAPDLSGKWKVAYKFNFKTIKSTMFLEQDKDHLTGRGVDVNTNEKFDIEKGWYAFPKVTIVRTYKKGKNAAADRSVKFKGSVEWVNDKDYQGPYLHGETEGGGDWEGQLVR